MPQTPPRIKVWPRVIGSAAARRSALTLHQPAPRLRGSDEAGEQGVRVERAALQLRVELDAHEPRMVGSLAQLGQDPVGRQAGKPQPRLLDRLAVADVDLVAMPMPLRNRGRAV